MGTLPSITYLVLHDLERPPGKRQYVHGYASPAIERELGELSRRGFTKVVRGDWHGGTGEHLELTTLARRALVAHRMALKEGKKTPEGPLVDTAQYRYHLADPSAGVASGRVVARDLQKLRAAYARGGVSRGQRFGSIVVTAVSPREIRWRAPKMHGTLKIKR